MFSIITKISRTASSIPWYVEEVMPDGTVERVDNVPDSIKSILECPNRLQTWGEFIDEQIQFRLASGNSYTYGLRSNIFPTFLELVNLPSQDVEIIAGDAENPIKAFVLMWDRDTQRRYDAEDVLHIKYANLSGTREQRLYVGSTLSGAGE